MTILVNDENLRSINSICSLLEISGENSIDFLNNLLISDLSQLQHGDFHYTALCNSKGRIISSLWINIVNDNLIYLICPKDMLDDLSSFFNMRKFRLKLNISTSNKSLIIDGENVFFETTGKNIKPASITEYMLFIFSLNLPWIGSEFSEKFIPQHVNLDQHEGVMSFTKGCYPGQEIIARLKYLGKIKKRMVLIKNDSQEQLAKEIEDLQSVSKIIIDTKNNSSLRQVIKINNE